MTQCRGKYLIWNKKMPLVWKAAVAAEPRQINALAHPSAASPQSCPQLAAGTRFSFDINHLSANVQMVPRIRSQVFERLMR
jgi:hypothetical protein